MNAPGGRDGEKWMCPGGPGLAWALETAVRLAVVVMATIVTVVRNLRVLLIDLSFRASGLVSM